MQNKNTRKSFPVTILMMKMIGGLFVFIVLGLVVLLSLLKSGQGGAGYGGGMGMLIGLLIVGFSLGSGAMLLLGLEFDLILHLMRRDPKESPKRE